MERSEGLTPAQGLGESQLLPSSVASDPSGCSRIKGRARQRQSIIPPGAHEKIPPGQLQEALIPRSEINRLGLVRELKFDTHRLTRSQIALLAIEG